jgi:poly-gamma-glutamate capsule biosynthesis protein CapA/YwtB (metallophosphatase superfamily)
MAMIFTEKGVRRPKHLLAPFFALFLLFFLISCQPEVPTVTLALLGDLMVGRAVNPSAASLSALEPELKTADLSMANLESPLADHPPVTNTDIGYNLCAQADRAGFLLEWGLDLLTIANNHRFDCSPAGPVETAGILTSIGLIPLGSEPLYREMNGLKLAFLAFDDTLAPIDMNAAAHAIQSARRGRSTVVVSVHWGSEYQPAAGARQQALAEQFAEAGAALVVGSHPHVLQPAEWIQTSRGRTLILFSLGNALFDQRGLADTRQSAMVVVTLDSEGVKSARAVPFEIDVSRSLTVRPDAQTAQQIHKRINLP